MFDKNQTSKTTKELISCIERSSVRKFGVSIRGNRSRERSE